MNKLGILFYVAALSAMSACTKNKTESGQSGTSAEVAKEVKPECTDGKSPQILEGSVCPGTWSVRADKKACIFKYGPPIHCPEGTKSTTYQAVCYGSVTKEGGSPQDASDCESQFGKVPNPAPYRLACCPI
jgi:hypothetical protein